MWGLMSSAILFVAATFLAGVAIGLPVAITLMSAAFVGLVAERGMSVAFNALVNMPYAKLSEGSLRSSRCSS